MADRRRLRPGIRLRTTLIASGVVALALIVAAVAAIMLARRSFELSVEEAGIARAEALAALATNDLLPEIIPTGENVIGIQVIDDRGDLVAWSAGMNEVPPLIERELQPGDRDEYEDSEVGHDLEEILDIDLEGAVSIVALGPTTPQSTVTVIVASSLDTEDTVDAIFDVIIWVFPLLLVAVALVTWWATGRALRPVDAMRREADLISGRDLSRRLPEPAARDEIQRLAITMNHMLDRLERSATEQRRFVGDASHELKSPVAAIRTMLEVARRDPESIEVIGLLDDLLVEDERIERIVGDLLTLARYDEGGLVLHRIDTDLDDLLLIEAGAAGRPERSIDTSGIAPIRATADPARLRQVIRNLLDNALRHSTATVWITSGRDGATAVITVSDDGPGLDQADRERVFDRFVRLDAARARDHGGTGLGLAVARAIARAHDGEVKATEPLRGGATFELRLPVEPA